VPAFHPEPTPAQGINCQISSTSTLLNFAPRRLLSAFAATSLFNHLVESGLHPCAGNGMMRRLLISLSSVVLVAFPLHAQTPAPAPQHDLKAGTIALVVTGEVLPGQMDNFRQLLTRLVAAVAEEPGTLAYEWSFHPDQKTYNVMEVYQNSDALVAHAKHVAADFLKDLGQVRKNTNAIVFGSPDAQAKELLARLDPVYTSHIDGFMR
jgi:quinol monooxygenase YgiN